MEMFLLVSLGTGKWSQKIHGSTKNQRVSLETHLDNGNAPHMFGAMTDTKLLIRKGPHQPDFLGGNTFLTNLSWWFGGPPPKRQRPSLRTAPGTRPGSEPRVRSPRALRQPACYGKGCGMRDAASHPVGLGYGGYQNRRVLRYLQWKTRVCQNIPRDITAFAMENHGFQDIP